mgnify:CR=1 FL=1|jgi:tRNA pseudouridine32 synthase/23S rRNA pseudouridine746 synthase
MNDDLSGTCKDFDIETIHVDAHILVVNKPSGLLSVPGRGPEKWDCVVHRVQNRYPTAKIVHRLDCATSGLMVLALDADSHRELSRQFHDREVAKCYEAEIFGALEVEEGEVNLPLMPDWPNRPRQMVHEDGKSALTRYYCLTRSEGRSRVKLEPITGRSHQLRVHMLSLGHPILGDNLYAHEQALVASPRLLLHATYLCLHHPETNEKLEFNCYAPF